MNQPASFDIVEESDRGCVLVGAAILENRLEELFRQIFEKRKVPKKLQASLFDSNGPLSTFSAKIKLAYSFGLIGAPLYEDLDNIRRIRNEFAHTPNEVDFIGSSVSEKIEAMHCVQQFKDTIKRYSPTPPASPPRKIDEARFRSAGFIKYTKSLFSLGVKAMEIELMKCALVVGSE